VGAGDLTEPVSVRARFERFPATVKGAFILRGEDADPHQVVFREANVVGIGLGVTRPMPMTPATLDVAPHRDVFVPFEMPVSELEPGWYTMTCDLEVDGNLGTHDGGRRFSVPWPRSTVRRGQVRSGRAVQLGDGTTVLVEQVDCAGDSIKLHLRVDPPGPLRVRLAADDARLEVLEAEVDETSGRVRITAYPLMRTVGTLRIELRGASRNAEGSVEVELP
jgi:hypothetical protein